MLSRQLAQQIEQSSRATDEVMQSTRRMIDELKASGIESDTLKMGDLLPSFNLLNAHQQKIRSEDLLALGPLVISFYRGSWCPLCNIELRAYQDILEEIQAVGASLVAISPEKLSSVYDIESASSLDFEVLTDTHNDYARELGLVFQLPETMLSHYKNFQIDLVKFNGYEVFELPILATYVVDIDGKIRYSYINANYLERAEPSKVVKVLQRI